MSKGNFEISLPLDEIHPELCNIPTSSVWNKLYTAELRREKRRQSIRNTVDKLKQTKDRFFQLFPFVKPFYMRLLRPLFRKEIQVLQTEENNFPKSCTWGEHLLLVVHFADRTGAPLLALNLAEQLFGMGYNLHVIVLRDGELVQELSKYARVYVAALEDEAKFCSVLDKLKPYQIKTAYLNTTVSGYYAKVLKQYNYNVVTLIHEMAHTLEQMSLQTAAENCLKYSDRFVIPSTLIKDNWQEAGLIIPDEITTVMPQPDYHRDMQSVSDEQRAASRREVCSELGLAEDTMLVIGCGTLEERKNPGMFFRTAELVAAKHPKVCFIWIGDYGSDLFKSRITLQVNALGDKARLLPYQNLNRFFYASDLFFLPSSADPFPTVTLLAAKNSLPIVFCSKSTGIRDLFQQVENCASDECSAEAFAPLIEKFAESESLRKSAGAASADIYRTKMYSFKEYAIRLFKLSGSEMPRVSCVIPNYNYAHYLPSRVNDALKQTYPLYELIILDDCSKDNSDEVINDLIEKYQKDFPGGIRYVKNTQNAGVFRQWMRGASMAKSDLIWIAEADDSCSPLLISKLVHAFTADPSVNIAYAQSTMMTGDGTVTSEANKEHTQDISLVKWGNDYINSAENEIENGLAVRNTIPNASASIMKKEALLQVPDEVFSYRVAGDWFAYLHILEKAHVAFCSESLNYYRRHENSAVAKNMRRLAEEIVKIQKLILDRYNLSSETAEKMKSEYLKICSIGEIKPESTMMFDRYVEERKDDSSFLFVFDNVSEQTMQLIRKSAEYFGQKNNCAAKRIFFVCIGQFPVPVRMTDAFSSSVHVVYQDDLCLYGFESRFCSKNHFDGAMMIFNSESAAANCKLTKYFPKKKRLVIILDQDAENSDTRIEKFFNRRIKQ